MSKPEDIPQDVWDTAREVVKSQTIMSTARALLAAEQRGALREREQIEAIIDGLSSDDLPDSFMGRDASFGDGLELALTAIRNRETDHG